MILIKMKEIKLKLYVIRAEETMKATGLHVLTVALK